MNDYDSYKSVKWGHLDSNFSSLTDLPEYKEAQQNVEEAKKRFQNNIDIAKIYAESDLLDASYNNSMRKAEEAKAELDKADIDVKNITDTFQKKFIGYSIAHGFRGKNALGSTVISHRWFFLDSTLKVTGSEDINITP